jgi:hypothetical protein
MLLNADFLICVFCLWLYVFELSGSICFLEIACEMFISSSNHAGV